MNLPSQSPDSIEIDLSPLENVPRWKHPFYVPDISVSNISSEILQALNSRIKTRLEEEERIKVRLKSLRDQEELDALAHVMNEREGDSLKSTQSLSRTKHTPESIIAEERRLAVEERKKAQERELEKKRCRLEQIEAEIKSWNENLAALNSEKHNLFLLFRALDKKIDPIKSEEKVMGTEEKKSSSNLENSDSNNNFNALMNYNSNISNNNNKNNDNNSNSNAVSNQENNDQFPNSFITPPSSQRNSDYSSRPFNRPYSRGRNDNGYSRPPFNSHDSRKRIFDDSYHRAPFNNSYNRYSNAGNSYKNSSSMSIDGRRNQQRGKLNGIGKNDGRH